MPPGGGAKRTASLMPATRPTPARAPQEPPSQLSKPKLPVGLAASKEISLVVASAVKVPTTNVGAVAVFPMETLFTLSENSDSKFAFQNGVKSSTSYSFPIVKDEMWIVAVSPDCLYMPLASIFE